MDPILFVSATVITGEEDSQPFVADVLVRDGLISQVSESGTIECANARRIDAKGQYLSPGFIDMHAHSDLYLITNPVHEAKISQGCTVSRMVTRPVVDGLSWGGGCIGIRANSMKQDRSGRPGWNLLRPCADQGAVASHS